MLTVQHEDGTLLSIKNVTNDSRTCKFFLKKMYMNVYISNLACILLFKYLLKKSFHLNVQDIIINLRG